MPWKSNRSQVVGGVDLGSTKISVVMGEIDEKGAHGFRIGKVLRGHGKG